MNVAFSTSHNHAVNCTITPSHPDCQNAKAKKIAAEVAASENPIAAFNTLSFDQQTLSFILLSESLQKDLLGRRNYKLPLQQKASLLILLSEQDRLEIFNQYDLKDQHVFLEKVSDLTTSFLSNVEKALSESSSLSLEQKKKIFLDLNPRYQNAVIENVDKRLLEVLIFPDHQALGMNSKNDAPPPALNLLSSLSLNRQKELLSTYFVQSEKKEALLNNSKVFNSFKPEVQVQLLMEAIEKDCDPSQYTRIPIFGQWSSFEISAKNLDLYASATPEAQKLLLDQIKEKGASNSYDIIALLLQSKDPKSMLSHVKHWPEQDQFKILSKLTPRKLHEVCIAELTLASEPSTLDLQDHDRKASFYKNYFSDPKNGSLFRQLNWHSFDIAKLIFKMDPLGITSATNLRPKDISAFSNSLNLSPKENLELFRSFSSNEGKSDFLSLLKTHKDASGNPQFQLFAILSDEEKSQLSLSEATVSQYYTLIGDLQKSISYLEVAAAKHAQSLFANLAPNQAEVYRQLSQETRRKLNLGLNEIIELSKAYSIDDKIGILTIFNDETFAQYYQKLSDTDKVAIYQKLTPLQKMKLAHLFNFQPDSLAFHTAKGNSPFTLEGAHSFIDRVYSKTENHFSLLFRMTSENPQVAAFNNDKICDDEQLLAGSCTFPHLSQVDIQCTEGAKTSFWSRYANLKQLEKGRVAFCEVTVTEKQTENKNTYAFSFPKDADRFDQFAQYNLPYKDGKMPLTYENLALDYLREIASQPGNALAAQFSATSDQFTNLGYGVFDPEHRIQAYFGRIKKEIPSSLELDSKGVVSEIDLDLSRQIVEGKKIEVSCNEDISDTGRKISCAYAVSDLAGNIFQSLVSEDFNGLIKLKSANLAILRGWESFATKVGIPHSLAEHELTLGESNSTSSDGPTLNNGILPSLKASAFRASEIAIFNILPTAVGAYVAYSGGARIKEAIEHNKKTVGQKIAGTILGATGVLAGVAIAYNRLNGIKLGMS